MRIISGVKLVTMVGLALLAGQAVAAAPSAWPAETISGKITMVEPIRKVVVIDFANNVPLDLVITPDTRIEANQHTISFQDLSQFTDQNVSVRFVPERRGDVAAWIHITD